MPAHTGSPASDHSLKLQSKKPKSREVSSRFLSSSSTPSITASVENNNNNNNNNNNGNQYPNPAQTLVRQKSNSDSSRKHKALEKSGFFRGLWPASSSPNPKPDGTLADCIGRDRMQDDMDERKNVSTRGHYPLFLNRQRSCTEYNRFDENEKKILNSKENRKPVFGGSVRYTGKLKLSPGKSSNPSEEIVPGRFSVDENSLRKKPFVLSDSDTQDSESEYSDVAGSSFDAAAAGKNPTVSYMASTVSSRKHGNEIPSRFLRDGRWRSDTGLDQKPAPAESNDSPRIYSVKKGNGNWGSPTPGWARSPKEKVIGVMNSKPPTSPSKGKGSGVGNILSLGIEFLKGKKVWSGAASPMGSVAVEKIHELMVLQNRLIQWRYGNARGEAVNRNVINQAQSKVLHAWNALIKLHHSVQQKKLQLQRQKLEWKLNYILFSQIKALEMWGNLEKQHQYAISTTKDCLHSVVCRIPLVDGAKVEPQTTSIVIRHASDIAASINLMLTAFSSETTEEMVGVMSELAMVVTQEKLLLEEYLDLYTNISPLEIHERSLKSSIMQLNLLQQQQQQYILA